MRVALAAFGLCAPLVLAGCSYSEIRPSAVEQDAAQPMLERFGPMRFQQVAQSVWQHTSYLDVPGFGSVPSNGMVVVHGDHSVLIDTAWTDDQTAALLTWAETVLGKPVKAAVTTHAHADKMGGMAELHAAGVETYAHSMSNAMAPENGLLPAQNGLNFNADGSLAGPVPPALAPLEIVYPGPGHTADNITVGLDAARIAFGGCLIKGSQSRSLGNLNDADTARYASTVERFAAAFPDAQIIGMSHSPFEDRKAIARTLELARELD